MSFNRIGLIIIIAGFIFLVGTATRQMHQDQSSEQTEIEQLASEKLEQERLAAEKLAKDRQATEKLVQERLATEKGLMGKLEQDRQAAERWQAAAEMARAAKPDLQVQTMIDPKVMVLVTTGKKKSRLPPKEAKTLVQKVRDQMGEGASVKILDGTGKEIARAQ